MGIVICHNGYVPEGVVMVETVTQELVPGTVEYHEFAKATDNEIVRLYGVLFNAARLVDVRWDQARNVADRFLVKVRSGDYYSRESEYFFKEAEGVQFDAETATRFSVDELDRRLTCGLLGLDANADKYAAERLTKTIAEYNEAVGRFNAARRVLRAEERKFTGWSRFFLVQGGHLHSSMDCSTCNNGKQDTQFCWYPELAGLTERDAVDAVGAVLCTVCFPTAPVEFTNQYDLEKLAKAARRCEGSGQYAKWVEGTDGRRGRYSHHCPVCGEWATITPSNKYRAHDVPTEKIEKIEWVRDYSIVAGEWRTDYVSGTWRISKSDGDRYYSIFNGDVAVDQAKTLKQAKADAEAEMSNS